VICIDARHAKAVLKMQINKSDRKTLSANSRHLNETTYPRKTRPGAEIARS